MLVCTSFAYFTGRDIVNQFCGSNVRPNRVQCKGHGSTAHTAAGKRRAAREGIAGILRTGVRVLAGRILVLILMLGGVAGKRGAALIAEKGAVGIEFAAIGTFLILISALVSGLTGEAERLPGFSLCVKIVKFTFALLLIAFPVIGSAALRTDNNIIARLEWFVTDRAFDTGIISHECILRYLISKSSRFCYCTVFCGKVQSDLQAFFQSGGFVFKKTRILLTI